MELFGQLPLFYVFLLFLSSYAQVISYFGDNKDVKWGAGIVKLRVMPTLGMMAPHTGVLLGIPAVLWGPNCSISDSAPSYGSLEGNGRWPNYLGSFYSCGIPGS